MASILANNNFGKALNLNMLFLPNNFFFTLAYLEYFSAVLPI